MKKPKVEILAPDPDAIFRPFFEPRKRAEAMRRWQPMAERRRWAVVFAEHGCIHCHRTDRPHASLGFCDNCRSLIGKWVRQAERELRRGEEV